VEDIFRVNWVAVVSSGIGAFLVYGIAMWVTVKLARAHEKKGNNGEKRT